MFNANSPQLQQKTSKKRVTGCIRLLFVLYFLSPTLCAAQPSRTLQARQLGWQDTAHAQAYCSGAFVTPTATKRLLAASQKRSTIRIIAPRGGTFQLKGRSQISGGIRIIQPGRLIVADHLSVQRNRTGKISSIVASGHVRIHEDGKMLRANAVRIDTDAKTGNATEVLYRLQQQHKKTTLSGWGSAKKVRLLGKVEMVIYQGNYSTCSPKQHGWVLHSSRIKLSQITGRGEASNAWLSIAKLPVFYFPYINFPIDDRRKSGLLVPNYSHSERNGNQLQLPIYWNIAPQFDWLITPTWIDKRGNQLKNQWRYLQTNGQGMVMWDYLANDRAFRQWQRRAGDQYGRTAATIPYLNRLSEQSDNRFFIHWDDHHQWHHWQSQININRVSDAYYFQDFDHQAMFASDTTILPNLGQLSYVNNHWSWSLLMTDNTVLNQVNRPAIDAVYQEMPSFSIAANAPWNTPLDLNLSANLTRFTQDNNFITGAIPVEGDRGYLEPNASYSSNYGPWSLTSTLRLSMTQYDLHNQAANLTDSPKRSLEIISLDATSQLQRSLKLQNQQYTSTLEPHLFYLYAPYRDQNNLPNFDSDLPAFSTATLYSWNRFTGHDRIGDANQLSFGLTSRLLNQRTGNNVMTAQIGGIAYFKNRRVCLDSTCSNSNERNRNDHWSPLAGSFDLTLFTGWHLTAGLAYEPTHNRMQNSNLNLSYRADDNHLFNISYEFVADGDTTLDNSSNNNGSKQNLSRVKTGLYWPVASQRWYAMAGGGYNISHQHPDDAFAGIEYRACCWGLRAVWQRKFLYETVQSSSQYDQQISLQLVLKGLGSVPLPHSKTESILRDHLNSFNDQL